MLETKPDTLLVKYPEPGFGITNEHQKIRTAGLATCTVIGGISKKASGSLFMVHRPDYDHQGHVSTLSEMGLRDQKGKMVVFGKNPEQSGLYTVRIDHKKALFYTDALARLVATLRSEFPNFTVSHFYYGDRLDPRAYSYAEIDLMAETAKTDYGSQPL